MEAGAQELTGDYFHTAPISLRDDRYGIEEAEESDGTAKTEGSFLMPP